MNNAIRESLSLDAFERRAIDFTQFDHEAHVYVAWLYLNEYDVTTAISRISRTLQRVALELGAPDKFHVTITWFYMLAIAERRRLRPGQDWAGFRAVNADLFSRDDNALWRYYTRETISSDVARMGFVLPDRLVA